MPPSMPHQKFDGSMEVLKGQLLTLLVQNLMTFLSRQRNNEVFFTGQTYHHAGDTH